MQWLKGLNIKVTVAERVKHKSHSVAERVKHKVTVAERVKHKSHSVAERVKHKVTQWLKNTSWWLSVAFLLVG